MWTLFFFIGLTSCAVSQLHWQWDGPTRCDCDQRCSDVSHFFSVNVILQLIFLPLALSLSFSPPLSLSHALSRSLTELPPLGEKRAVYQSKGDFFSVFILNWFSVCPLLLYTINIVSVLSLSSCVCVCRVDIKPSSSWVCPKFLCKALNLEMFCIYRWASCWAACLAISFRLDVSGVESECESIWVCSALGL